MASLSAWLRLPGRVRKGEPPSVQARVYSNPCCCSTASTRAFRLSGVLSVEKRKLKSTSTVPGMTFKAPVPAWMLLTCQVVGGKWSLPSSQVVAASAASAGASWWMGLRASCG